MLIRHGIYNNNRAKNEPERSMVFRSDRTLVILACVKNLYTQALFSGLACEDDYGVP